MRILLIHQYFLEKDDAGGSRWNEMTKSWTEKGHEVTVIAGMMHYNGDKKKQEYKGKWFARKQHEEVAVVRTHVSESYNNGFLGRLWGYFSFMFSSLWAGLFKVGGDYDAVIVTSPPLFVGISGYLISLFKRAPMIFEVRDLWPESAIDTGVLQNKFVIRLAYGVERFIYNKSKLINVLTPAFRLKLLEKGVPDEKIIFIPNAADFTLADKVLEDFDADVFKKELGLAEKMVITYVGAHGVANHLIQVLDAAEELKDTNVVFQLIGGGMQKQMLVEEAAKRKLPNVIFRDPVPKQEVFKYILASDMGASILKRVDTFKTIYSNKTFDYFSCKKPVLLAIDGVSRELVEEARAGSYVEPENSQEYSRIIRAYIENPEKLAIEGVNGYLFAKRNFDRIVLAEKYLELIKASVENRDLETVKNPEKRTSSPGIPVREFEKVEKEEPVS